ncbi:peptidyl-dipeptidase [Pacificimonas flava]|uniref:Peptidyl-dipeptidase n=2 Tax=Pacificimonas TaxID=1960290 RepID=A0A219B573_9SPHN|nr:MULTISPECIES: M2 family metallopeptidase [Pacificimonas]MBZ6379474.1 M2 family metallopeptidase [Pacificimonas aurantium]OWV33334.1 peptidyl-dipeptidase [Pacificimonas flava]
MLRQISTAALAAALLTGAARADHHQPAETGQPTAADARSFVESAEERLADLSIYAAKAAWVNATYINVDTDFLAARAGAEFTEAAVELANQAARYAEVEGLDYDTKRKLNMLRQGLTAPAPDIPGAADELSTILTGLQSAYGKGTGTYKGETTRGNELEALMGTVRDPELLEEMWTSWHRVGVPMKEDYARFVEISNEGAQALGYADTGAMWRSGYDMDPDEFARLLDRTWNEVKPLYDQLHCYVRAELNEEYGDEVQPADGPIRADLLGNMWAQEWGNIYPLVAPEGAGDIGYDLTDLLEGADYTPVKIVETGEAFFTSLGFDELPETFWQRSQITAPADREVVCHASAWDVDNEDDLRIKMCTRVNADDFVTVHHELGHNFYQRAYSNQPFLYKGSANDGFHEAVGDFIALSVTPEYLVDLGLLDPANVPDESKDIGLLLRQALDKVAFLPFGLLIDKWRWQVFSGEIQPADYNSAWTQLRFDYQGITPPGGDRPGDSFDPGAKYHVPGNTPYTRYYLARLLQFQFHKAACDQAGWEGPLHRCSIYADEEVGEKLNAMLAMGSSRPWPDALEAFTGTRDMNGSAMAEYFAPLTEWLEGQNRGRSCGW